MGGRHKQLLACLQEARTGLSLSRFLFLSRFLLLSLARSLFFLHSQTDSDPPLAPPHFGILNPTPRPEAEGWRAQIADGTHAFSAQHLTPSHRALEKMVARCDKITGYCTEGTRR